MMCQSLVIFYLLCFSKCLVRAASSAGSNDGFSHHAFSLFPANDRGQRAPAGVADSLHAVALSVCATPWVQVIRFLQPLAWLIGCGYPRPARRKPGSRAKGSRACWRCSRFWGAVCRVRHRPGRFLRGAASSAKCLQGFFSHVLAFNI